MEGFDPRKIGGSSAAAVLGLSPYESTLALYERLRGGPTADSWAEEEAARLEAGRHMEPLIAKRAEKLYGVKFNALGSECLPLFHAIDKRIVGHVDGWLADGAGAEMKLTGQPIGKGGWGEPGSDNVPGHYLAQCCHYLALTDAPRWHLFALRIPSYRLDHYVIERREPLLALLIDRERDMLRMVDAGTPPDPATEEEARRLWFRADSKLAVNATDDVMRALLRRHVASQVIKACDEVVSASNLAILSHMREAGLLLDLQGDGKVATAATQRVFDGDQFELDYPEIAARFRMLDKASVRRKHPQEYAACMTEAISPDGAVRQIRLSKEFKEAARRLVADQACALPYVPEVSGLFLEDDDDE
jgi:predicted phage-related endonuclease